jgi:hypothetical protein
MSYDRESRIKATCAIGGALLPSVRTYLHPMHVDPPDSVAAFTEYAADQLWVASHLANWQEFALIVAARSASDDGIPALARIARLPRIVRNEARHNSGTQTRPPPANFSSLTERPWPAA